MSKKEKRAKKNKQNGSYGFEGRIEALLLDITKGNKKISYLYIYKYILMYSIYIDRKRV